MALIQPPRLLSAKPDTWTFTGSEAADSSYPSSNLNDYETDTYWQSNTTVNNQYLEIDAKYAISANMVVIHNHNFDELIAIATLSASNISDFSSATAIGTLTIGTDPAFTLLNAFSASAYRYYRLYLTSTQGTSLEAKPYLGNIFVGEGFQFNTPAEYTLEQDNKSFKTFKTTALDGTMRSVQLISGRPQSNVNFKYQTELVASGFHTFVRSVEGRRYPFYYIDSDNSLIRYCHLLEDYNPVSVYRFSRNNIGFGMLEHST